MMFDIDNSLKIVHRFGPLLLGSLLSSLPFSLWPWCFLRSYRSHASLVCFQSGFSLVGEVNHGAEGYFYYNLSLGYIQTGRDLRRMESNTRSPIFASFGELLDGIVTVRCDSLPLFDRHVMEN